MKLGTHSPRSGKSNLSTIIIVVVVAVIVSMWVCPRTQPRPLVRLIDWVTRLAPVVPFFFDAPRQPPVHANYEMSQHALANAEPERVVGGGGEILLDHGHGW